MTVNYTIPKTLLFFFKSLLLLWHRTKNFFKVFSIRNYNQIGCT